VTSGGSLDISGTVTNAGDSTVDTQLATSSLLVNGQASDVWGWAIANGLRSEREFALPPGEQVEFRRVLPSSLLPGLGRHELVLEVHGHRSPTVMVERL
jgi:hypothetical protein